MLTVALAEAVLLLLTIASFSKIIHSMARQSARERETLINQIMHLSNKTWQPPPSEVTAPVESQLEEFDHERYITSPDLIPEE